MSFGDIVRQWNYLERITDIVHGNQCYQDFSDNTFAVLCFFGMDFWDIRRPQESRDTAWWNTRVSMLSKEE